MESFELEQASGQKPTPDTRPRLDELTPVRLIVVDDPRLPTPPGKQPALDNFYVGLLQF